MNGAPSKENLDLKPNPMKSRKFQVTVLQRMILSAIALVVVATMFAFAFVRSKQETVNFAEQEMRGDAYQRPLLALLNDLGEYQVNHASSVIGKNENSSQISSRIDKDFVDLAAQQKQNGAALKFDVANLKARKRDGALHELVQAKWASATNSLKPTATPSDNDSLEAVVGDLKNMIAHSTDMSNLSLDTDLDSYYLATVTTSLIPQTMDRMTQIATKYVFRDGQSPSRADRLALAADVADLKDFDLGQVAGDMDTSFAENPNFGKNPSYAKNLAEPLQKYKDSSQKLIDLLSAASQKDDEIDSAKIAAAANGARQAAAAFWRKAVDELDGLLKIRTAKTHADIQQTLLLCTVAMMFALGCFAFVVRSILGPLSNIKAAMLGLTQDNQTVIPHTDLSDEIGAMARALEVFKENAIETEVLQQQQVENERTLAAERERVRKRNRRASGPPLS